jgi:hypothetical protein
MARQNVPLLSIGNRGLVSPKALARVDLDRTRLSAEVFENFVGGTQGYLSIRPGTKYFGSSFGDTGATFVEFVASTDDVALLELTANKMRIWQGSDAHNLSLLSRPKVDTEVDIADTGWVNASTGGILAATPSDIIPKMTGETTGGVRITASSSVDGASFVTRPWRVGDNDIDSWWQDTGTQPDTVPPRIPSWLNVDFGSGVAKSVSLYTVRAGANASLIPKAPSAWRLLGANHDTGTYATDTGKWVLENQQSAQTGWSVSEQRSYDIADTGTIGPWRHWRLYFTATDGGRELAIAEIQMLEVPTGLQSSVPGGKRVLNARSIGAIAKATKRVIVDTGDVGVEHALVLGVERGPVTLRVGSSDGDDDYVRETSIGTGNHNLSFTPEGNFYITMQTRDRADRIVSSLSIGDSGTVEITTPWAHSNLDDVRYDQSADVVFIDCDGVRMQKIERRGTGRSWSVVDYAPGNGPFLPFASSSAKLTVSKRQVGNGQILSDAPYFTADHVGALFRLFHEGQSGTFPLGARDAATDVIEVTGIRESDTGSAGTISERRISFSVSGTYTGRITIERSMDGKDLGFKEIGTQIGTASDTGTFSRDINDPDDNIKVWYRARMSAWTSGVANVSITYRGGGKTGIARVTGYNSTTEVEMETMTGFSAFGDTGLTTNWQEGYWSAQRGYPSAVALHSGRLGHAQGGSIFLSVSDDYENFDGSTVGEAGPIVRTLGSGPVDRIHYLLSLLRLIIGTAGAEIAVKSSSLDEPITPENCSAMAFSTQGSANVRALKMDARGIFVQRSGQRLFMVGAGTQGTTFGDYENMELTLLVPDLLRAGIVSIAVQRQPDTRLWCVLGDGSVAVLLYEPQEEVMAWFTWSTEGFVEKVMVLPGVEEDAVYLHIRRTINGVTKRYVEKVAKESECVGDTGLSWIMDCAVSMTDTGLSASISAPHLAGENVIVWGTDTGTGGGKDFSPDSDSGVQLTYALDGSGNGAIGTAVKHKTIGLPFSALWKSTKLAYAAEMGTALSQMKTVPGLALSLYQTHNNGLFYGTDSGELDPLPRMIEEEEVDPDRIFETLDMVEVSMPRKWHPDIRLVLKAKAPRPSTVLAAIPKVVTQER